MKNKSNGVLLLFFMLKPMTYTSHTRNVSTWKADVSVSYYCCVCHTINIHTHKHIMMMTYQTHLCVCMQTAVAKCVCV